MGCRNAVCRQVMSGRHDQFGTHISLPHIIIQHNTLRVYITINGRPGRCAACLAGDADIAGGADIQDIDLMGGTTNLAGHGLRTGYKGQNAVVVGIGCNVAI